MTVLRSLLLPLAWLYGMVLRTRHALYDNAVLTSVRATVPTIAIGNLALGGTGKTPLLELVLRILEDVSPLATLSRGYGRDGTELHEVSASDNAERSGDEPLQVKKNFPDVRVFVGADRVGAINSIVQLVPELKAVVLDDALQHRQLNAGLNILLTTWHRPYSEDALLPAGRLRDVRVRANAAQIIVLTKCPTTPSTQDQLTWRTKLNLKKEQELFFSGIQYGPPPEKGINVLLFTGIADPAPLVEHVRIWAGKVEHVVFTDHHSFSVGDLERLAGLFGKFAPGPKMLVTTEKDAARLSSVITGSPLEGIPLEVIRMRAVILNEPERFAELIHRHVATHQPHR
jgi:tetraacyldisaccharide 4'-kinase